ncbi:MAG: hypothetical protein DRJ03_22235 [Chloroflexi bacterium]|nr:MAG: hypothetical protein DRJ03_22235 [Chloroflexota bacterium]
METSLLLVVLQESLHLFFWLILITKHISTELVQKALAIVNMLMVRLIYVVIVLQHLLSHLEIGDLLC